MARTWPCSTIATGINALSDQLGETRDFAMVQIFKSLLWLPWAALMLGVRMASSLTRGPSAGSPAATTTPSASGAPSVLPPGARPDTVAPQALRTVNSGRLNTASFVVLG